MTNFKSVFCRNKQVCLFIKIFKIFKCHLMLFDIIILHYCTFSYIMLYQTKLTRIIVTVAERNKIQIIDYAFQYSLYIKKFLCPSFYIHSFSTKHDSPMDSVSKKRKTEEEKPV